MFNKSFHRPRRVRICRISIYLLYDTYYGDYVAIYLMISFSYGPRNAFLLIEVEMLIVLINK